MDSGWGIRLLQKTIRSGIIALAVFAPLAFGAVHVWAYSVVEISVIFLMGLWLMQTFFKAKSQVEHKKHKIPLGFNLLLGGFVCLIIFQLIPFSPKVIKRLSPAAYDLYRALLPKYDCRTEPEHSLRRQSGSDSPCLGVENASCAGEKSLRPISIYPFATKTELLKLLSYIGLFYLVTNSQYTRKQVNWLIAIIILVGCFEAFYGLLEYISGHQYILLYKKKYYTDCVTGTFINRNHFAGYLELVIALTVGVMVYQWHRLPDNMSRGIRGIILRLAGEQGGKLAFLGLGVILMLLAVIGSQSRMGILSITFSLVLMSVFWLFQAGGKSFLKFVYLLFLAGCLAGMWLGPEPLINRFSLLRQEARYERSRVSVWHDTLCLISDFPLLGSGLGTYRYIFPKYRQVRTQGNYQHAHNDYLELAAETGLVGFAMLMTLAGYFIYLLIKKWRRRNSIYVKGISLGGLGGLAALLFHGMADFNMHIPANPLLLSIIMGISWRAVTQL
jgi:O-antigen ligase